MFQWPRHCITRFSGSETLDKLIDFPLVVCRTHLEWTSKQWELRGGPKEKELTFEPGSNVHTLVGRMCWRTPFLIFMMWLKETGLLYKTWLVCCRLDNMTACNRSGRPVILIRIEFVPSTITGEVVLSCPLGGPVFFVCLCLCVGSFELL